MWIKFNKYLMNHSNLAIDQFDKYYYYHLLILKINSPKYNNIYFLLAVDCGDPPVPENGDVTFDDTTFGNQATQSCNSGYELQGVVIRTCQANGKWSDDVVICTRKLDTYTVSINDFTKNTIIIYFQLLIVVHWMTLKMDKFPSLPLHFSQLQDTHVM